MLHFVMGTAGTGKTTWMAERIRDTVESGGKAIYIVPEQFSFEGEKLLYRTLGPKLSLSAEVLSFTRLCNSVFREFGGLAGMEATKTAKYLLMSIAVDELKENLKAYKKSVSNMSFLDMLLSACSEFKSAGVTPNALAGFSSNCQDDALKEKTADLSVIYAAYQSLLDKGYNDPEDCLIRASATLRENDFFSQYAVFVDGFTAFMAGEYELLGHAIEHSPDIWFAMTADSPYDTQNGIGLFSPVKSAVNRLTHMARERGVPVEKHTILEEPHRYKSDSLAYLSKNFLLPGACAYCKEPEGISLYAADEIFDEMEYTAASIARLVRENGFRYNEIAVVAREADEYVRAAGLAFSQYGIPWFYDMPEDIENKALPGAVLTALEAMRGFDSQDVLALAKNPVMGLEAASVAECENYAYMWGVRGAVWHGEFKNNPRGLAGEITEDDKKRLDIINEVRAAVITPLLHLKEGMRAGTGGAFARSVYSFLEEIRAGENLIACAADMSAAEREGFLDENARLWDELVGILDVFGDILGNIRMPVSRLCELFRLASSSADVSAPPQTLDQVLLGKADRVRPGPIRAVFVIGANEGVFPPASFGGGLLSDNERKEMIEAGLLISPPSLWQVSLERYFAYFALTLPCENLYVSYRRTDLKGAEALPSLIVSQLKLLFPSLSEKKAVDSGVERVAGVRTAMTLLARIYGGGSVLADTLRDFLKEGGEALHKIDTAFKKPPHVIKNPSVSGGIFGGSMRLSPTKLERYHRCPFSYFAHDGLGLRKRRKVEFSPLESGSVIHHVLHIMVQKYGGRGLALVKREDLQKEISDVMEAYIKARIEDTESLPTRFRYLFERLCGMLSRLLERIGGEFAQSKFDPTAFEMPISRDGGTEPIALKTADGTVVTVEGIVDRVDVMEGKNGRKYVRVIDYKSGTKDFKLQDVLYGLNLQMLIYLFTIQENGTGTFKDTIPAGVLYMPVREQFVSAERNTGDDEVKSERAKQWRMSGLLLQDEEALRGMEENLAGVYIPVKLKRDGSPDSSSAIADLADMGKLSTRIRNTVINMADSLKRGEIPSLPVDSPDFTVCAYCDYKKVCGFENGDPVRRISKIDREKVLKMLEENSDA